MVSEGIILESVEQKSYNERILKKIFSGAKLTDIMIEISRHRDKTENVNSDLRNYNKIKMLSALKNNL